MLLIEEICGENDEEPPEQKNYLSFCVGFIYSNVMCLFKNEKENKRN